MTPSPRPRPPSLPPVQYKGGELDAARGPGLGCFWVQLVVLAVLVVLTPIGVNLGWPDWVSALLLFATIGLLLVSGQTIIFLLRIVAAERREGRRRPMAVARTATVGELEDETAGESSAPVESSAPAEPPEPAESSAPAEAASTAGTASAPAESSAPAGSVRAAGTAPAAPAADGASASGPGVPGDEPVRE